MDKLSLENCSEFLGQNQRLMFPIITGEQLLLQLVLCRAIMDVKDSENTAHMTLVYNSHEAFEWFFEDTPDPEGFSFHFICSALSQFPDEFKRKIREYILQDNGAPVNKLNFFLGRVYKKNIPKKKKKFRNWGMLAA